MSIWVVVSLIVAYVITERWRQDLGLEGFVPHPPRRSDIGRAEDGWVEEPGYDRDLRFTEGFVDIQQRGWGKVDFCRAVTRRNDPKSLRIACALGARDGMDTLEYTSRTVRDGFRMSRDDYFNGPNYCRVLCDPDTGLWGATCAVAGRTGFSSIDVADTNPPPHIKMLLDAYEGIGVWYRWQDDGIDYASKTVAMTVGPSAGIDIPAVLNPVVSRGLQLNRWPQAAQAAQIPPAQLDPRSYIRFGDASTMILQTGKLRAMACWVWWDVIVSTPHILDCGDKENKDHFWFGVESGTVTPAPVPISQPAVQVQELRPEKLLAVGKLTEPVSSPSIATESKSTNNTVGTYVFEVWDQDQRLVRLESPAGARVNTWQHVVLTTTDSTSWWPTWQMWIDGQCVASQTNSRLCPAIELFKNCIGRDMRGCIQDFRMYERAIGEPEIQAIRKWGQPLLHPMP